MQEGKGPGQFLINTPVNLGGLADEDEGMPPDFCFLWAGYSAHPIPPPCRQAMLIPSIFASMHILRIKSGSIILSCCASPVVKSRSGQIRIFCAGINVAASPYPHQGTELRISPFVFVSTTPGWTCEPSLFPIRKHRFNVSNAPELLNERSVNINKSLDVTQATTDEKFESFGSRLQEAVRKYGIQQLAYSADISLSRDL